MTTTRTRIARSLLATAAAALTVGSIASSASALPIGGGGGGTDPTAGFDATINGTVSMVGCSVAASQVGVSLRGSTLGTSFSSRAVVSATATPGVFSFSATDMPHATTTITVTAPTTTCPFGQWSALSRTVGVPLAKGVVVNAGSFVYTKPNKVTRIAGSDLALAALVNLGDLSARLDSSGSTLTFAGTTTAFSTPDKQVDMTLCSICPTLGTATFKVRDMNSARVSFDWPAGNAGLNVALPFETNGREIKGYYSIGKGFPLHDSLMPDMEISGPVLNAKIQFVADGAGGMTARAASGSFGGSIQATGPCSVFGWDPCDSLFGYKDSIATAFTNQFTGQVNAPATQATIAAKLRSALDAKGIGRVVNVFTEGDGIVVTE